jgi:short-subunit dehydrogenase
LNYPALRTSHLQGIAIRATPRRPLPAPVPAARRDPDARALAGKTAVVTGASRGIGAAIARELARCGVRVVLVARSGPELDRVVASVASVGGVAAAVRADLSRPAELRRAADEIAQLAGVPDLLVNNAGAGRWRYTEETSADEAQAMLAVPFLAAFQLTGALLPGMLARGSGHVVNMTSALAFLPIAGATGYSSARWAMRGFTESLRLDLHDTGVGVTLLIPGAVDSPYFEHNPGSAERLPWVSRLLPTIRPEDVAHALVRGLARGEAEIQVPRGLAMFRAARSAMPWLVDGLSWHTGWRRPKGTDAPA